MKNPGKNYLNYYGVGIAGLSAYLLGGTLPGQID